MRFSNCGAENPDGLKFCNECGAPLKRRSGKCGFENAPTAKFCGECAASLSAPIGGPEPSQKSASAPSVTAELDSQAAIEGER